MNNKTVIAIFALCILLISSCAKKEKKELPKIAIAGFWIECSTFSPAKSEAKAFKQLRGDEIFDYYPFFGVDSTLRKQANWVPTLRARAIPGGVVTKETYESFVKEILEKLKVNGPFDGMFLDIHGASSVEGMDDPEGDLISRIRQVVGTDCLISTSMDLHGNVTKELVKQTDLITCFRLAPHEDAMETRRRAVQNLVDRLESGKGKPKYKAWIPVPVLLPGEKTSTRIEPGKSLYAKVDPLSKQEGVIDAAIWVGYAWGDAPRNIATVTAYGDNKEEVAKAAEYLAKSFWDVRKQFEFVAPVASLDESLHAAINSDKKPFIISDMGDNPTAGGAGDVTWTLAELLKRPEFKKANGPSLIYASIPGPKFVEKAVKLGEGAMIEAEAGANVDSRYSGPVLLKGKIEKIRHGDKHAETEVVVKVGSMHVIVTKIRKPYHHEADFTNLGLNPRKTDIVMVKIGYLVPELYKMRGDWLMALTPGGVDQDLIRLGHKRIQRPMFPFDADMEDPDLSARMIPLANE
ncbi:M81 family metallopeptidase [Marinifilum sp.]|uniref:M81 family metallopeptidase n=1 Tax=Marinifilum sp. TaxID=2033137 RepID=UPI003BACB21C